MERRSGTRVIFTACRLIACARQPRLLGWAALSSVSTRPVYRGVAEVSVYVTDQVRAVEALVRCCCRS